MPTTHFRKIWLNCWATKMSTPKCYIRFILQVVEDWSRPVSNWGLVLTIC
jgi:hypothetical protein